MYFKELVLGKRLEDDSCDSMDTSSFNTDSEEFGDNFQLELQDLSLTDEEINEEIENIDRLLMECHNELNTIPLVAVNRPIVTFDKQLNDMEMNSIVELSKAAYEYIDYEHFAGSKYLIEINNLLDFCKVLSPHDVFDDNVRASVKLFKGISKFNDIEESDQMCLLKQSCWIVFVLKKLPSFDLNGEHWTFAIVCSH